MESTGRLARSFALASFLGSALVGCAAMDLGAPESAEAGFDVDESYFYVSLSSHGNWVNSAQFGWVWYPYNRPSAWRPYTMGRWVYTSYGEWMWVSDEPFGWATYHYGRWYLDPSYGWAWVPGRVWAPAWVSWRDCDDYVGWAPLAPWGYWDTYYGGYRYGDRYWGSYNRYNGQYGHHDDHHGGHDNDHDGDHNGGHDGNHKGGGAWGDGYRTDRDDPDQWNFTRKRDFAGGRVDKAILDRRQVQDVFRRSRDLPPPSEQEVREGRGVSRGFDRGEIERASGRPIRPVKVEDETARPDPKQGWGQKFDEKQDRVRVYRPTVNEKKPNATPDRLGVARPVDRNRGGSRDERGGTGGGRDTTRQPDRNAKPGGGSLWPAPSRDGDQGRSSDLDPDRQRELDRKREVETRQDDERRREVDRKRDVENRQDAERRRELDRQREEGNRKVDERRRAADLERGNEGRPSRDTQRGQPQLPDDQRGGGRESGQPAGKPSSGYGNFDRSRPGSAPSYGNTREPSRVDPPKPERAPSYQPSHQPSSRPDRGSGPSGGGVSSPYRGSQPSAPPPSRQPSSQPSYQQNRGGDSGGGRPSGGSQPGSGNYGGHGGQGSPGGHGGRGSSGGNSGGGYGSPAGGGSGGFGSPGGGAGGGAGGFGH